MLSSKIEISNSRRHSIQSMPWRLFTVDWFEERANGQKGRARRIAIVAVAR